MTALGPVQPPEPVQPTEPSPDTPRPGALARLALASYPPSFRARYGRELAGLVDDVGGGPRTLVDLLAGSLRAWLRPVLTGDSVERRRQRYQATVSTVWVAWSAVSVGSLAILRATEDPPPTGFDPHSGGWLVVHAALNTALVVGWLVVLAVGVPLGLRALRDSRPARRTALPPVVLLGVAVLAFVPLQVYASTHWIAQGRSAADSDVPVWWAVYALCWLLLLGAAVVWTTVALPYALRVAAFPERRLRRPVSGAAALVLPMAVVVGLVLAVVVGAGPSAAAWLEPAVWVTSVAVVAALVASVTSCLRSARLART